MNFLTKGLPFEAEKLSDNLKAQEWNILQDSLPFPLLVLKDSVLERNIQKMAQWCKVNKFELAPHGKTTMCPKIFERQLQAGAWGITVATASQAKIASHFGVNRILMANQLVGKANIALVVSEMNRNPDLEFYCLVDSIEGIRHMVDNLKITPPKRPVKILLEWGKSEWRTGFYTHEQVKKATKYLLEHNNFLDLCGFEGYEGMASIAQDKQVVINNVNDFLSSLVSMTDSLNTVNRKTKKPLILSIGGSEYLDLVRESCGSITDRFKIVIRSGCYITHDHGYYAQKLAEAQDRMKSKNSIPVFEPALELWAVVQSFQKKGKAILTFGKRDGPYDLGLPKPLYLLREGQTMENREPLEAAEITNIDDQHAYLKYSNSTELHVGDKVVCGISHPCTAFDKWSMISLVDDNYNVLDWYRTYF